MTLPEVTIIVAPREQFSKARQSLESIFAHTKPGYDPIYTDLETGNTVTIICNGQ